MSQIFYYGADNKVYGPHSELTVQGWYASGFFSSDVRFQISSSDRFDPSGSLFTLGELIEKNGRILPFYFSPEENNREKEYEKTLQKLKEDVESLLTNKDKNVEKGSIDNLQNQIASILESNAAIHKKLQDLSSKKESSPVTPDVEKKLNELKREVEKQEKNAGSMKKVMSDNTSKCDRTDTKMELTMKKQKEIEEQMAAHSNQIADLQANGKGIDSNLTACREAMRVSSDQCGEMMGTLTEMKKAMDKQTEEQLAIRSELQKIQMQITEVIATMDEHKERLSAVEKQSEEPRANLQSLNGFSATTESAEPPNRELEISNSKSIPPWELETKKTRLDAGIEPWNHVKDSKNGTHEAKGTTRTEAAATGDNSVIDAVETEETKESAEQLQKDKGQGSERKQAPPTKAKPIAKDWASICRELSDDDEPELVNATASSYVVVPDSDLFVREFMKLLRAYCAFLESPEDATFKAAAALFDSKSILNFFSACPVGSAFNRYIREALKMELGRILTTQIMCTMCNFRMVSPRMMVVHFVRTAHGRTRVDNPLFGAAYTEMTETIAQVFMHFITPIKQLYLLFEEDRRLTIQGLNRAQALTDADVMLLKGDFVVAVMERATNVKKDIDQSKKIVTIQQASAIVKEACTTMRAWLEDAENRQTLEAEFISHGGIAACGSCNTAYEKLDDYYKHMSSYSHAEGDQTLYTALISLWKGDNYWTAILGL